MGLRTLKIPILGSQDPQNPDFDLKSLILGSSDLKIHGFWMKSDPFWDRFHLDFRPSFTRNRLPDAFESKKLDESTNDFMESDTKIPRISAKSKGISESDGVLMTENT